jgi:hypothetical protein
MALHNLQGLKMSYLSVNYVLGPDVKSRDYLGEGKGSLHRDYDPILHLDII